MEMDATVFRETAKVDDDDLWNLMWVELYVKCEELKISQRASGT